MTFRLVTRRRSPFRSVSVVAVSVFLAVLPTIVAGASVPSTSPTSPGSSSRWAWGALRQVSLAGTAPGALGAVYSFSGGATFGFATVLSEKTVANGTIYLNASRVMGSQFSVTFCRPDCVVPMMSGTISHRAWEALNASAVLTASATTTVNGSAVPALGLQSLRISLSAGVVDTARATVFPMGLAPVTHTRNVTATLNGSDALALTPSLGLVPVNLTPGEAWSSTSAFVQNGSYAWTFAEVDTGGALRTPHNYTTGGSGSFNRSGNVTVAGQDSGSALNLGGSDYRALNLSVESGPFALREGWLLVPAAADTFGPGGPDWKANQTGFANTSQANVEVGTHVLGSGHLAFGGSGEWWFARSLNPAQATVNTTGVVAWASFAPTAVHGSNATYVQGSPESPATALSQQGCLASGTGCPALGGLGRGPLGAVLLLTGVVALGTLVAMLVIGQRRRLPPTVFPNASLYPPGTSRADSPRAAESPGSSEPASDDEDDPLSNLW